MRKLKLIFSILTVVFASLGLAKILSYDISLPLMFVSMILTFLVWSKECYNIVIYCFRLYNKEKRSI